MSSQLLQEKIYPSPLPSCPYLCCCHSPQCSRLGVLPRINILAF